MFTLRRTKWQHFVAISLAAVMLLAVFAVNMPVAAAADGLEISWFQPESTLSSDDSNRISYKVDGSVDPDNVHFQWNFSKGLDRTLKENLDQITLKNKDTGVEVSLDRGKSGDFKLSPEGIITAGDFKYTKKGGGDGTGGELRLLELILKSTVLESATNYVIELGPDFEANNEYTLGKTYVWEFTTSEAADTSAPAWPQGSELTAADLTPTSLVLHWDAVEYLDGAIEYKIYQDDNLIGTTAETVFNVSGLALATNYRFKVEAGDVAGNWSTDGPGLEVLTPSAPVLALTGAEITKKGDLSLTFNREMADPAGTEQQFKVIVDGTEIPVKAVQTTNTPQKIKLVLEETVVSGQDVTLTYTQSEEPDQQLKAVDGKTVASFTTEVANGPAKQAAPALTPDTTNNIVGRTVEITFENDPAWTKAVSDILLDGRSISGSYQLDEGKLIVNADAFDGAGEYNIMVKASGYADAVVVQKLLKKGSGGSGGGSGTGDNKDQDFVVEKFNTPKLVPAETIIRFDFSKGVDSNLNSNLERIKVYEKSTAEQVKYSSHNYIKQGNKDNPPKIRRLELTYKDLKSSTTYVVEIGSGFKANNGNELQGTKRWEFTTTAASSGSGGGKGAKVDNVIGKDGGTVTEHGARIEIPVAACDQEIKVTVKKVAETSKLPLAEKGKLASDVVEITKDKAGDFKKPVTITLNFDKSKVDTAKYNLSLCRLDEKENKWVALDNVKVDLAASKVSGETIHFTKFAVIATLKAGVSEPVDQQEPEQPVPELKDITGHWAEQNIEELVASGAIKGYPNGTFQPDRTISRAEFAVILVKAFNLESKAGKVFNDTADHWAKDAIAAAAAEGIVSGYSDTTFGPDDNITREQMAAMIVKAAKLQDVEEGRAFADSDTISSWAKQAVATASYHKIIAGRPDHTFGPKDRASRAEAATVIVQTLRQAA